MASKDPAGQTLLILWSAMLFSQVMLFGVGQIVPAPPDSTQSPEDLEIMAIALTGVGVMTALGSALGVPLMFRGNPNQAGVYQTMMIMRCALAEASTIFGLVLAMLGAEMQWVYVLTGLGIVAHLVAFPTQSDREAHAKK